jgi:hypothetical protein
VLKSSDRRLDLPGRYFATAARSPEFVEFMTSGRFPVAYNDGNVALFENKSVLPRAFAVPANGIRVMSGTDAQLESLKDSNSIHCKQCFCRACPLRYKAAVIRRRCQGEHSAVNHGERHQPRSTAYKTSSPAVLLVSQTAIGLARNCGRKLTEVFAADLALTGIAAGGRSRSRADFSALERDDWSSNHIRGCGYFDCPDDRPGQKNGADQQRDQTNSKDDEIRALQRYFPVIEQERLWVVVVPQV